MGEVSKKLGELWKGMGEEDKEPFEVITCCCYITCCCMPTAKSQASTMCQSHAGDICSAQVPAVSELCYCFYVEGSELTASPNIDMQASAKEDKERVTALKAEAGNDGEAAGGAGKEKKPKKEKKLTIKSAYMVRCSNQSPTLSAAYTECAGLLQVHTNYQCQISILHPTLSSVCADRSLLDCHQHAQTCCFLTCSSSAATSAQR